jgi:hypothetical protein
MDGWIDGWMEGWMDGWMNYRKADKERKTMTERNKGRQANK